MQRAVTPLDDDLSRTIARVREGRMVLDRDFDRLFPEAIRRRSAAYFSPFLVARRAAAWLTAEGATRILDVGAGAGKVCIIGALTTGATFTGIEHRASLVEAGQAAIRALGIERAHLLLGTIASVDFDAYEGLYFFNPFEENLFEASKQLDQSVPLSAAQREADVAIVEQALERARVGTRVVTFYGLGGRIPPTFQALPEQSRGTALLRFWVKVAAGGSAREGIFDGFARQAP